MARFGTGNTNSGVAQKLAGRSASSRGDVRSISSSVVRRIRASRARPRLGRLFLVEDLVINASLPPIGLPCGDDSAIDFSVRAHAIGVDQHQAYAIGHSDGHEPPLAVTPSRVLDDGRRAIEDQRCELEIKSALP